MPNDVDIVPTLHEKLVGAVVIDYASQLVPKRDKLFGDACIDLVVCIVKSQQYICEVEILQFGYCRLVCEKTQYFQTQCLICPGRLEQTFDLMH